MSIDARQDVIGLVVADMAAARGGRLAGRAAAGLG